MNIAICGLGKAGKALARKLLLTNEHQVVCGLGREESSSLGKDLGDILHMPHMNIPIVSIKELSHYATDHKIDVIIDFSYKTTSLKLLEECNRCGINLVICTTNFEPEESELIIRTAKQAKIGVVNAPNLTLGINLIIEFVERISRIATDFDFVIVERHRKDKPIGTTTAKIIAQHIDRDEVPIHSVRAGGYVGIHEVTAASENEKITIEHESFNRDAFANGALLAANFVYGKKGYYEMKDVIAELEQKALK